MFSKYLKLLWSTRFVSRFLKKKVSQGVHFFAVAHVCTKSLNKAYKKSVFQNFQLAQPLHLPTYELVVFVDMNTYILTIGRNFKTFLKENYVIALGSCYLSTKKMLTVELNSVYRFRIPSNLSIWWIWQFSLPVYVWGKFLTRRNDTIILESSSIVN